MTQREILLSFRDVRKLKAGQKFGDLKLIRHADGRGGSAYWWVCKCWCDNVRVVEESRLITDQITMCVGCEVRTKMNKPIE
jgi:hypothetical protein